MTKRFLLLTVPVLALFIVLTLQGEQALAEPAGSIPLRAGDGVAGDMFGYSADYDGATIVVGAPRAMIGSVQQQGAVYVFSRAENGQWIESAKLWDNSGEEYDWFGSAVAVDGDVIAVGAPLKEVGGVTQQGLVYIYERDPADPDNWLLVTTKTDFTIGTFSNFGDVIDLDGDQLIVGAPSADIYGVSGAGAAYIYGRDQGGSSNWGQIVRLRDSGGDIQDNFGSSVALQGDRAVVGSSRADVEERHENEGAAFVFERDFAGPGVWGQVARLIAPDPQGSARFGDAVTIDGSILVVGAYGHSYIPPSWPPDGTPIWSYGEAYVFEESSAGANDWALAATLKASDWASNDFFGNDVAVNGATVVIGAPMVDAGPHPDQGAIYRYGRDTGGVDAWGEIDKTLPGQGLTNDYFGDIVIMEGSTIVVSSYGSDAGQGVVYVIDVSPTPAPGRTSAYVPLVMNRPINPNGVLVDGDVFEDNSGAVVGAVTGTLSEPLNVLLETIDEPALPYTDGANPVGPTYRLAASESFYTPADKPFLVGLPVPAGANPDDLAVAILEPAKSSLDSTAIGEIWHVSRGAYDPASDLFSFTLASLHPAGITAVLVEHPDNELLTTFGQAEGDSLDAPSDALSTQGDDAPAFSVSCGSYLFRASCTAFIMADIERELIQAYIDFTGLGFLEPNLNRRVARFLMGPLQPSLALYTSFYDVNVLTGPCADAGVYHPSTQDIDLCVVPSDGVDDVVIATIRHELFHAIQDAYPALEKSVDWDQGWVIEGTAAAAEHSLDTMVRASDYDLRQIRPPLTSDAGDEEYEAQDFWIYTGLATNQSLAYLEPIFGQGAEPADVDNALPLGQAYWNYVKNQIIEKDVTFEGALPGPEGALPGPPCEIVSTLIGNNSGANQIEFPATAIEKGALAPLSAVVLEITFKQDSPWLKIHAGTSSDLAYKVYESGEGDCANLPDGEREFTEVAAGEVRYVVMANTSYTQKIDYAVTIIAE